MSCRWIVPVAVGLLSAVPSAHADAQPLPDAPGRVVEAADGDVVVLPTDANVTIVHRAQAHARLVYIAARQTLLLLTDPAIRHGNGQPDAKGLSSWQVQQPWPLEPRWQGQATIDEYTRLGRGPSSLAIHTDRGTILIGPSQPHESPITLTPAPIAVVRSTSARSRATRGTFDEIEQAWLSGGDGAVAGTGPTGAVRVQALGGIAGGVSSSAPPAPAGALRVGGNIRMPAKLQNADPVYPATAQRAGVQGVVILELHIGPDGAVTNALVLRSIPPLDQAAIDAVRQWRYEPTLLNGAPVPLILTATVNFALQPPAR